MIVIFKVKVIVIIINVIDQMSVLHIIILNDCLLSCVYSYDRQHNMNKLLMLSIHNNMFIRVDRYHNTQ